MSAATCHSCVLAGGGWRAQEPPRTAVCSSVRARRAPHARLAVSATARTTGAARSAPSTSAVDLESMGLGQKVAFAWNLFFPVKEAQHARADAKKRLRMILVADRCALSAQSMAELKEKIVRVVSEFVVVDQGELVDVSMTNDEDQGTVFSVAIPVKRVKPSSFEGEDDEVSTLLEEEDE